MVQGAVAIIPARGGSKRISRKNVRLFHGKPIIAYSIDAAISSGCFSRVVVSTDDDEIAEIASAMGAEVPFMRPSPLADDQTPLRKVVNHAICELTTAAVCYEHVCCIFATAPFLKPEFLRESYAMLIESGCDFILPLASFSSPVQRAICQRDGVLCRMWPEHRMTRSQDLERCYHDAGSFYWGKREAFIREQNMVSEKSRPYFMPRHAVVDIDDEEDWEVAEHLYRALYVAT